MEKLTRTPLHNGLERTPGSIIRIDLMGKNLLHKERQGNAEKKADVVATPHLGPYDGTGSQMTETYRGAVELKSRLQA